MAARFDWQRLIQMVKRRKSVLKLEGFEKWAYILKENPKKIQSEVREEFTSHLLSMLTEMCSQKDVIAAINMLNTDIFLNPPKDLVSPLFAHANPLLSQHAWLLSGSLTPAHGSVLIGGQSPQYVPHLSVLPQPKAEQEA